MTLAQLSSLFDAERRFNDPKGQAPQGDPGTLTDLALFASMKVG